MVRKILKANDPRLRQKSKAVKKIDKKILSLVADLRQTLIDQKNPEGVGLAAPQIGKNLRIFVTNLGGQQKTFINPKILALSNRQQKQDKEKKKDIMEGCLSIPHYYGHVTRAKRVKLKYTTKEGKEKVEIFQGFPAQIVQHEIDHLNGQLFVDRLLEQKERLYKLEGETWKEVDLVI